MLLDCVQVQAPEAVVQASVFALSESIPLLGKALRRRGVLEVGSPADQFAWADFEVASTANVAHQAAEMSPDYARAIKHLQPAAVACHKVGKLRPPFRRG